MDQQLYDELFRGKSTFENYIHFKKTNSEHELELVQVGYQIPYYRQYLTPKLSDHYLLHFICSGSGYLHLSDRTYCIPSFSIFLIKPNQVAFYHSESKKKWEYYWLGLEGHRTKEFLEILGFSQDVQAITFQNSTVFQILSNILSSAILLQNDYIGRDLQTTAYIRQLLFTLKEDCDNKKTTFIPYFLQNNSNMVSVGKFNNKYIKIVTEYIQQHYQDELRVEEISNLLHVNRSYLSSLYKKETGKTIKQYIQHHRILCSTLLLQRTNLPISDIAARVGFQDSLYFSRVFKDLMGVSPTEYRSRY